VSSLSRRYVALLVHASTTANHVEGLEQPLLSHQRPRLPSIDVRPHRLRSPGANATRGGTQNKNTAKPERIHSAESILTTEFYALPFRLEYTRAALVNGRRRAKRLLGKLLGTFTSAVYLHHRLTNETLSHGSRRRIVYNDDNNYRAYWYVTRNMRL